MKYIKPKKLAEANVQAELYRQLKNNDIDCVLEYAVHVPLLNCGMRIDVIIISKGEIIAAIECKSRGADRTINRRGRQYRKYQTLGVPFFYCMNIDEIPKIVNYYVYLKNKN